MEINLGFSTGCLKDSGRSLKERLGFINSLGCRTVELSFLRVDELKTTPMPSREDLGPFDYVSLHAPKYSYRGDEITKRIIAAIESIHFLAKQLDLVVFHPDTIEDFSILENLKFPIAFENMDHLKSCGGSPSDMLSIFSQNEDARMVLDVNHAFTHNIDDADCRLTSAFWNKLHPWIDQVHLSGYAPPEHNHWPLFKTKQDFIIQSIENFEIPVIIESVLSADELVQERDYILGVLEEPPSRSS